ncbi:unnamed protein product [Toxocara canis]|uniref:Uncharacterized protein n=1 Tax=Toxocara canis TaxID=6265 RepID=A0A183VE57_TOXCA|nr:unnamed protein product [Toxocara canis]
MIITGKTSPKHSHTAPMLSIPLRRQFTDVKFYSVEEAIDEEHLSGVLRLSTTLPGSSTIVGSLDGLWCCQHSDGRPPLVFTENQ